MAKIDHMEVSVHRVPLPQPVEAFAAGLMVNFDMVLVRLWDTDGVEGLGYSVCHEGQGPAIGQIAGGSMRPFVEGADADLIEAIWHKLYREHHYAGRGAPVSFALAAIDVALWDLKGRKLGQPLWRLMGGFSAEVRAYAGNIDLNFPKTKLLDGASASVEAGFRSVKMRLGRPSLAEDLDRAHAMRAHLPDEIEMMADANEAWRVDQCVRAMHGLKDLGMVWLEEPIAPDDIAGQVHLRSLGLIPLALGENLHTVAEFTTLFAAGAVDMPQPDLTTCGGYTPWLKVARLAEANNLPVMSHGAHELHIHCMGACPNAAYLEWHAFDLGRYMEQPLTVSEGFATAPDRPGHGITFDMDALGSMAV